MPLQATAQELNLALPGVPPVVHSDTLVSYEAGWKTLLLNKRISVDLAVYDIDWKNIQLNNTTPSGVAYLANGGRQRVRVPKSPRPMFLCGTATSRSDTRLIRIRA